MKKIYIKINGITCNNCKMKIIDSLKNLKNINSVLFDGIIAEIEYKKDLDIDKIINRINDLGYFTEMSMTSIKKNRLKRNISSYEIIIIALTLAVIFIGVNQIFGYNIFNSIPIIDNKTSYFMIFVAGIFTSIHCISMCGAINLVASIGNKNSYKKPIFYNIGRLISYTLLGGIVGLIGNVLEISQYFQGIIIILSALIMLLISLNMTGITNLNILLTKIPFLKKIKTNNAFIIGLLNGFMPCGPLQAMQLYSLSTGSFAGGALSMFLFGLGTIPLMLIIGIVSNSIKGKMKTIISKISIVLILLLSLIMLNRGLSKIGINITNLSNQNYENYLKAEIKDGYQYIEFDLTYSGYQDIILQKNIPVRLIIKANFNNLTGCNNSIIIDYFDINQDLKYGENIIEFTPTKEGKYIYSCYMNMLINNIVVIDDIDFFS